MCFSNPRLVRMFVAGTARDNPAPPEMSTDPLDRLASDRNDAKGVKGVKTNGAKKGRRKQRTALRSQIKNPNSKIP